MTTPLTPEAVAEMRALLSAPERDDIMDGFEDQMRLEQFVWEHIDALLSLAERALEQQPSPNAEVAREIVAGWDPEVDRWHLDRLRGLITAALDAKDRESAKAPAPMMPTIQDFPTAYRDPGPTITTDNTAPAPQPAGRTMAGRIHSALAGANLEYSAVSWGGFNLFGDKDSIAEFSRLQHEADRGAHLSKEIIAERERTKAAEAEAFALAADTCHHGYSGDYGDHRCKYQDTIAALERKVAELEAALREITEGRGRYSQDRFEHAVNTIEDLKALAREALSSGTPTLDKLLRERAEWMRECAKEVVWNHYGNGMGDMYADIKSLPLEPAKR